MSQSNNNNLSVLMFVCKCCNNDDVYEIIAELLKYGADVNQCDKDGNTALSYLVMGHMNSKSIKLLLSYMNKTKLQTKLQTKVEAKVETKVETKVDVDWRQKYLDFFVENIINWPPLSNDEKYDWKFEYERVSKYPHWNMINFKNLAHPTLDLTGLDLTEIPKEIGELVELKTIFLTNNLLNDLPDEIGNLVNLTHLYLSENKFKKIPNLVFKLKKLIVLSVRDNNLTNIQKDIGKLNNLEYLNLKKNSFINYPKEILSLENLKELAIDKNDSIDFGEMTIVFG